MLRHFMLGALVIGAIVITARADSFKDDFSGYATEAEFKEAWYVYKHPPNVGAGEARLDTTADAVLLSAKQKDGGKTFTLTQLLNLQHKHRLGAGKTVTVEAEFDQTEAVPWVEEPIAPNRLGLSGKGIDIWGQVGLHKKGDGQGTLVAKVAYRDGSDTVELKVESTPGHGSYDGEPVALMITGTTLDLKVSGESVIGGAIEHGIDFSTSALGQQDLQAFVQQQRVFAPQPRSCVVHYIAVTEE